MYTLQTILMHIGSIDTHHHHHHHITITNPIFHVHWIPYIIFPLVSWFDVSIRAPYQCVVTPSLVNQFDLCNAF